MGIDVVSVITGDEFGVSVLGEIVFRKDEGDAVSCCTGALLEIFSVGIPGAATLTDVEAIGPPVVSFGGNCNDPVLSVALSIEELFFPTDKMTKVIAKVIVKKRSRMKAQSNRRLV